MAHKEIEMGTLRRRNNKWHVQIRRKHYPSQTNTFNNKLAAVRWVRNGVGEDPLMIFYYATFFSVSSS